MIKFVKQTQQEKAKQFDEFKQSQILQQTSVTQPGKFFFRKKVQKAYQNISFLKPFDNKSNILHVNRQTPTELFLFSHTFCSNN